MKIVSIVGPRPQFIKAAAVTRVLTSISQVQHVLVHTGQHYDENMSEIFFRQLEIPKPDYHLAIGSGTHGAQTGRMLEAIEQVLRQTIPDLVLVYGDTNSTLAGGLAAVKLHIRVAHIGNKIFLVGDVMYDASLYYSAKAERESQILQELGVRPKEYVLATIHRAENTDDFQRLGNIFKGLELVAKEIPVVIPLHPRAREALKQQGLLTQVFQHICVVEPLGYLDMVMLEKHSLLIATDSGGVQKEAFFYDIPCTTLRSETEWVNSLN